MPVFPTQNLETQKICESYNKLLQIYDTGIVLDGTGSQQKFLNVTSSWSSQSISASYAPCNCPIMLTGSTYPITASWALNTITTSLIIVTNVSNPIKRVYSNYTITGLDYTILCDSTSGSFDVKLPSAASTSTRMFNIKKIDKSGHFINVTTQAGDYIDYDVTQSISHRGTNMSVQSDGIQYWIL